MIDYENPSPETLKEWEKEFRNKSRREMRQYLKLFPDATSEEKRDLSRWVRSGHSPYENGDYISTESGGPMDFINARRFLEDKYLEYLKDSGGFRDSPDDPTEFAFDDSDPDVDLPF